MLAATALVLLMTPALGLFYAGLVRSKNTLNTFMMCIARDRRRDGRMGARSATRWRSTVQRPFIGGLDYAFLHDVAFAPREGSTSPTCCSWPSRRPSASSPSRWSLARWSSGCASGPFMVFAALWSVLVYSVLAHWSFGGGWLHAHGTLDFAGGVPVEMGSGFSALAAALVVGARKDYGRQALLPHNAVYVLLGAGLLWFGWFGFNGGSGFSPARERARLHQHAALPGLHAGRLVRARPDPRAQVTAIGAATAIIVGCVGITPAAGYVSPGWAMALGALAALPSYAVIVWRPRTRVDETLDVLAAHGVAGFTGILFIGFFAQLAGTAPRRAPLRRCRRSSADQALAALAAPAYAFVATFVLLKLIGAGDAAARERARGGARDGRRQHGEEAYATGEGAILVTPEDGGEVPVPVAQP